MKRGASVALIVGLSALIGAGVWTGMRIVGAAERGRAEAKSAFEDLRRVAVNTVFSPEALAAPDWAITARAAWEGSGRILALVVRDESGDVLYALPASSPYYRAASSARGLPGEELFQLPSFGAAYFGGPVSAGMRIDAALTTLTQGELFAALRDALIAYGAVMALGLAAIAALAGRRAPAPYAGPAADAQAEPDDPWFASGTGVGPAYAEPGSSGRDEAARSPSMADDFSIPDYVPGIDDFSDLEASFDDGDGPALNDEASGAAADRLPAPARPDGEGSPAGEAAAAPEAAKPLSASLPEPELAGHGLDGPRGLFDPETGLCWESYLRERLDAELKRSASFEQDLSLLIANFDRCERGGEEYNLFAKTTQEFFSFKDLSFQFGKSGVSVILPNMDVDHAIRMSEELLKKLTFLLQGRKDGLSYLDLFIGLSSRSGRLVEADRMVGEAMAALRKAREERDTRIMAFRPDPEKFRAFLAGR